MESLALKDDYGTGAQVNAQNSLQLIAFSIGEQTYGVEITTVREIRAWNGATPLPNTREYVRGVINLRGVVLPVVDLRCRLGLGQTNANPKDVIVVVQSAERTIGLLVDAVSDILTVTSSEVQPTPELARESNSAFIEGIAVLSERMVTILSMDKLIASLVGENLAQAA